MLTGHHAAWIDLRHYPGAISTEQRVAVCVIKMPVCIIREIDSVTTEFWNLLRDTGHHLRKLAVHNQYALLADWRNDIPASTKKYMDAGATVSVVISVFARSIPNPALNSSNVTYSCAIVGMLSPRMLIAAIVRFIVLFLLMKFLRISKTT
jgi:hypothetical protein